MMDTFILLLLGLGGGILIGFTMSSQAFKHEIDIARTETADKQKELSQCYNEINQQRAELAYYKSCWSSHLRKTEEFDLNYRNLEKGWEELSALQEEHSVLMSEIESLRMKNMNVTNRLKRSVRCCQKYKKKLGEMKNQIRKLEICVDELYQCKYSLENQLDHQSIMSV